MGVLTDYFRAPDDAAAATAGARPGGPLIEGDTGETAFDGLDAKGIDPSVVLGKLIALTKRLPWSMAITDITLIYPSPADAADSDGPWVSRLADAARDALAELDDRPTRELARQWAQIEEFGGTASIDDLEGLLASFSDLARRSRNAGDHLYCWISL